MSAFQAAALTFLTKELYYKPINIISQTKNRKTLMTRKLEK